MRTVIRKHYSSDFKARAVEMLNLGRSVPEVAEEFGIGTSILYRWAQAGALRRLREDNAQLRMENDILKKAAVILGTPPPSRSAR